MGRLYREKEIHGVKILYIESHKTRVCTRAYADGRGVWLLLPDGRIGYNNIEFFKWAHVGTQPSDVRAAEALWRLGAIKKDVFQKVETAEKKHREKKNRGYAIDEFKGAAQHLGIPLTAAQMRALVR